jgi:hypothetical protein
MYLAARILVLAGHLGGVLFVAGIVLWFVGAVMAGYTERPSKSQ